MEMVESVCCRSNCKAQLYELFVAPRFIAAGRQDSMSHNEGAGSSRSNVNNGEPGE